MFTIEEVQERTGLDISVLRKYIQKLKPYLNPYIRRGESNRLLFDPSSIIIWDKIKQLKEEGYTLPTIKQALESIQKGRADGGQSGESASNESIAKGLKPVSKPDNIDVALLNELKEALKDVALEKEKRLAEKDEIIRIQKELNEASKILLALPEGKSPEDIKKDLAAKDQAIKKAWGRAEEALKIAQEMSQATGIFNRGKRKRLKRRLDELAG
ncbi:MerR family transcriptional regulator [Desulfatibacillum aliphaticivorans]|uniref:MerR family transcriptional regulator n=1 Tax=Desulfatibacillum aliphaticivorans TaxID=218208 RepID=UPI000A00053E|nr:MerR family transcriptional regulator [Desulfatibacillum aliphaticivorans]